MHIAEYFPEEFYAHKHAFSEQLARIIHSYVTHERPVSEIEVKEAITYLHHHGRAHLHTGALTKKRLEREYPPKKELQTHAAITAQTLGQTVREALKQQGIRPRNQKIWLDATHQDYTVSSALYSTDAQQAIEYLGPRISARKRITLRI